MSQKCQEILSNLQEKCRSVSGPLCRPFLRLHAHYATTAALLREIHRRKRRRRGRRHGTSTAAGGMVSSRAWKLKHFEFELKRSHIKNWKKMCMSEMNRNDVHVQYAMPLPRKSMNIQNPIAIVAQRTAPAGRWLPAPVPPSWRARRTLAELSEGCAR